MRRIINAGMQHAAVATARMAARVRFFFDEKNRGVRMAAAQFKRYGETYDAGAENDDVGGMSVRNETLTHSGQTRRTTSRTRCP